MISTNHTPPASPLKETETSVINRMRKIVLVVLAIFLILVLMAGSGAAGYWAGNASYRSLPPSFLEAWNLIHNEYVDQPVNDTKLAEGAIDGLVQSLGDSHSGYMPPAQYSESLTAIEQSYSGIGAEVDVSGPYLRIIAPFPESPAAKAGLQPGDEVLRIDGIDMTGIDPKVAVLRVHGPSGSIVKLSVRRGGSADMLEFSLTRAEIKLPSIISTMMPGDIAYIRLVFFGGNSGKEVHDALVSLMAKNPKGLILDLRGNPGGLVSTAVEVASEFLPPNQIITVSKRGDGTEEKYETRGVGLATKIPMVVLVDAGSASSSEMVSGALQDYERATLVGTKTYGKGSMQDWHALSNGTAGAVRLTIARFYSPKGHTIDQIGLRPDLLVEIQESDRQAGKDPQLEAALHLLTP
jgi:carboxyl-terminal processing protease